MQLARQIPVSDPASVTSSAKDWLISGEASRAGLAELLDGLMTRLVAAGMPFERATFHLGTLHPQVLGFTAVWNHRRGVCNEFRVNVHIRETSDFQRSPLKHVIDEKIAVRLDPRDPRTAVRYPMMSPLADEGFTDYWGFPIPHPGKFHCAMTVATRAPTGFARECLATVRRLIPALALNLEIVALGRIAENVLAAYIGERSSARVLAGEIKRGSGEVIEAVVWVSDMRDYSALSDRLPGPDMIRLLNAYFERLVGAVRANDGEVLKFIGDGMLAVFPIGAVSAEAAAEAAVKAAIAGLSSIEALNGKEGDALNIETPWRPLRTGIALHRGSVFYGNIGSADRLDFTVTGPAVNLTAKVEPLCKTTGHPLLLTHAMAELLKTPVAALGSFECRGLVDPVPVYALASGAPAAPSAPR
jgi:adenylate cyclase